ncbi:hypothetical protein EYF80_038283 [Liparis tanakae]|uniref:Uncharacterized protein n=1 Tax=Liparis tanakae TaxID=230148 RepID=A0A4Z2GFV4_9TELE|nr:hypothetical protein EYF80_038283 [Liparis tanakae]
MWLPHRPPALWPDHPPHPEHRRRDAAARDAQD